MNPLIFITGAPGTGKSTTASELEASLEEYTLHSLCQVRRDLGHKRYMSWRNEEAFGELMRRVAASLEERVPVIIDTAVARTNGRQRIYDLAAEYNVSILVLECTCSPEEARRRVRSRLKHDGLYCESRKPRVYDRFMETMSREPISLEILNDGKLSYVVLDTQNGFLEKRRIVGVENIVGRIKRSLIYEIETARKESSYASAVV